MFRSLSLIKFQQPGLNTVLALNLLPGDSTRLIGTFKLGIMDGAKKFNFLTSEISLQNLISSGYHQLMCWKDLFEPTKNFYVNSGITFICEVSERLSKV